MTSGRRKPGTALPQTRIGRLVSLGLAAGELAVGGILGGLLFVLLIAVSFRIALPPPPPNDQLPGVGPLGLGFLGLTEANPPATITGVPEGTALARMPVAYLLPFEIVSVHLLVVLVGAAYLARAKRRLKS